jgi:hypothetical protein
MDISALDKDKKNLLKMIQFFLEQGLRVCLSYNSLDINGPHPNGFYRANIALDHPNYPNLLKNVEYLCKNNFLVKEPLFLEDTATMRTSLALPPNGKYIFN